MPLRMARMQCPNCHGPMTELKLDGQLATQVSIDLCLTCQAFWFDGYESLKLTPGSVLKLFQMIGEQKPSKPVALSDHATCPRCQMRLVPTHDIQHATRFEYLRCPVKHGRLTTFFNFLREKDFIRPLTPQQVDELRRNVQTVNCANCGASIDLAKGSSCAHCGSPLSMLDMHQAQALVDTLKHAEVDKSVDPAWPLRANLARREVDASFESFDHASRWVEQTPSGSLVTAGIAALAAWLKDRQ
jgi:NAD-dependent SIR2 family protein deacetylase